MRFAYQRGLTLIEMVVAVSVFAVVVTASASAFVTLGKGTGKAKFTGPVNQTSQLVIEKISREAKFATGFKDSTGRVWPPFLVEKANSQDSAVELGSNILTIVTKENGTANFKIYAVKDKNLYKYESSTPKTDLTNLDGFNAVTPPDVKIAQFDLDLMPDPKLIDNLNWTSWHPDCDSNKDGGIDNAESLASSSCTGLLGTKRATQQPLLEISHLTFVSSQDPSVSLTLETAISSRDYDLDN